jgi:hypothetical protein
VILIDNFNLFSWLTVESPISSCTSKVYSSYVKWPANRYEFEFMVNMNLWEYIEIEVNRWEGMPNHSNFYA